MRKSILFLALGLLTTIGSVNAAKEVYTVFKDGTLTYYYDDLKDTRIGTKEVYDPEAERFEYYYEDVITAVIDASMLEARLESMENLFYGLGARALKNLTSIVGMENLYTASVTNMTNMFAWCSSLTSIDLHAFNTSKVTDMTSMFRSCSALKGIDVNSFDMSKVVDASTMFDYCKSLTTIYCYNDWSKFTSIEWSNSMFRDCEKLVGGKGTVYNEEHTNINYAHPDGGTGKEGYFTMGEIPTSVNQLSNDQVSNGKFIRNGQLFIQRGEEVFSATGVRVK